MWSIIRCVSSGLRFWHRKVEALDGGSLPGKLLVNLNRVNAAINIAAADKQEIYLVGYLPKMMQLVRENIDFRLLLNARNHQGAKQKDTAQKTCQSGCHEHQCEPGTPLEGLIVKKRFGAHL